MERDQIAHIVTRNIEAALARKRLTPVEVARRIGTNPTIIYDILSGKSKHPRLDTLNKIATKGLGIPMSSLFTDPDNAELSEALRELVETLGMLPPEEQRRFLGIARALLESQPRSDDGTPGTAPL